MIATTVPYQFIDNRVVIQCTVDGKGPYSFVLDTGAGVTVITPDVARALKLKTVNAGRTTGVGNSSAAQSSATLGSVAIGGFTFAKLQATVLDLSEIRDNIGFRRFDGVIGLPILEKYSTKIDADAHTVTFSSAPISVPKNAEDVPFTLDANGLVHVPATIDAVKGVVILDTGDRSSFTLFGPFAQHYHFYNKYRSLPNALTGFGIGGAVRGDVFRLPSFDVLGTHLTNVVTRASRQHGGVFATGTESGSIGGGVLRRFDIVYDYPHRVMHVWPSAAAASADPYDRSGMWLSRDGSSIVVRYVAKGGPAAVAGVTAGAQVVALNGKPMDPDGLPAVRTMLATSPAGTRVRLQTTTGGKASTQTLTLRELL